MGSGCAPCSRFLPLPLPGQTLRMRKSRQENGARSPGPRGWGGAGVGFRQPAPDSAPLPDLLLLHPLGSRGPPHVSEVTPMGLRMQ